MRGRWMSRLSPCPRSLLTGSRNAFGVFVRARRTSWWKCLRSYRTLPCSSGLSSSPLTLQFIMIVVAGAVEEFKVSLRDRVQQCFVEQNSSTFQFLKVVEGWAVEVFKVSPRNRAQQRFMEQISLIFQFLTVVLEGGLQGFLPGQGSAASSSHVGSAEEAGHGFFPTFPRWKKSAGLGPHSGTELGADFNPWTPAAYAESMEDAYDEAVEESEAAVVLEEGAETRFAAGFRPMRMQFLVAIGAPSHTHGLSFTRKPQPMSSSSPRTFRTEVVVAASRPGGGVVWR